MVYCQNCGKDTAGAGVTFYGNVLCGEACKKNLSERLYFRDTPPEPGSTWFCPHCGGENPMGDPRKQLRPNCNACGKPLDPASAAPPKKQGCLGLLLLMAVPVGLACASALAGCASGASHGSHASHTGPGSSNGVSTSASEPLGPVMASRVARQRRVRTEPTMPAARVPVSAEVADSAGDASDEPVAGAVGMADDGARSSPQRGSKRGGVSKERAAHHRKLVLRGAAAKGNLTGPVIAVGPIDAVPADGVYLHGAKFEPPYGRVLHGMGQWASGNESYLQALDDPALQPASKLIFMAVGDSARPWPLRMGTVHRALVGMAEQGYIPHLEISLFGLDEEQEQEGIDGAIAISDRYDGRLRDVARAVRSVGGPVFVRIGGEFNGYWNPYSPCEYVAAYRRIVEIFRAEGVENAAFVWCYQPDGAGDFAEIDPLRGPRWYPGDDVVDWFGLDVFDAGDFSGPFERGGSLLPAGRANAFLRMALDHDKPVTVAESSPAYVEITSGLTDGEADWADYFAPFFQFLEANPNIQAFHYINVDWTKAGEYGLMGWKDARIEQNPLILERFKSELRKPRYLHSGHEELLNGVSSLPPAVPAPPLEPPRADEPIPGRTGAGSSVRG